MSTVCFGNDHFTAITRYGDYVQGNLTICHAGCYNFSAHLPAEIKVVPHKMTQFIENVGKLRELIEGLELDFPVDPKGIPTKLDELTNNISTLTLRFDKLEGIKLYLLTDLVALLGSISKITKQILRIKILDVIPDVINKVVFALDKLYDVVSSIFNKRGSSDMIQHNQLELLLGGKVYQRA
ncbi:hypothetical protein Tco_0997151 [Tanacetum coccineum]